MQEKDNEYAKFIHSLWNTNQEYEYFKDIHGMLITPDRHHNYLINWVQLKGGSGKTLFANCAQAVFGHKKVITLPRAVIVNRASSNKGFSISRMKGKFFCIVEEATNHVKTEQNLDIRLICELTGGGHNNALDKYEKGKDASGQLNTAKLFMMSNNLIQGDNIPAALERRLLIIPQTIYFRHPNSPQYNEDDPNCKIATDIIQKKLKDNPDHIFTYYLNAGKGYQQKGCPNLKQTIPDTLKKKHRDILNGLITIDYVEEQSILNDFIMEQCYLGPKKKYSVLVTEFCDKYNIWLKNSSNYKNNTKWSQKKIRDVFESLPWTEFASFSRPGGRLDLRKMRILGMKVRN